MTDKMNCENCHSLTTYPAIAQTFTDPGEPPSHKCGAHGFSKQMFYMDDDGNELPDEDDRELDEIFCEDWRAW